MYVKFPVPGGYELEPGIPTHIAKIGNRAFGKTALTEFAFHEGLQTIGDQAFYESKMTDFVIPSTVSYIGNGAFSGCPDLGIVNVLSSSPATLGQFAFGEPLSAVPNLKILVPQDALSAYEIYWGYYADRIQGRE